LRKPKILNRQLEYFNFTNGRSFGRNMAYISGIIPSMIYYGLQILSPAIFLPAGNNIYIDRYRSSWTTSAAVEYALI
jgi:hypothetical protein